MDKGKVLHVLFLPYLATGHLIPLVNTARIMASLGGDDVRVTILTTPQNALLFQSSIICGDAASNIAFDTVMFPASEVGLPQGLENLSAATSQETLPKVFHGILLLQKPMEERIRQLRPDCIFSDRFFPWTVDVAEELNIPRIMFNQSGYMYNTILHHLNNDQLVEESPDKTSLSVLGLPDDIEFKLLQLQAGTRNSTGVVDFDELLDQIRKSEDRSYGIVHDTFYELEPAYADYYRHTLKKNTKCWHIGPISRFSFPTKQLIRTNAEGWLNEQEPESVLYVSFGSMVRFSDGQLSEIAQALEASGVPFIWALKDKGEEQGTTRTNKGLMIRGWAPQLAILDHSAISGFMTHCGWNSTSEAIAAGVPMLTWPISAEQFFNEKLVEVVGLGVKVGSQVWNLQGIESAGPVLGSEKIQEAIARLMTSPHSKETQNIRERATTMSKMAKDATQEGGSSWNSLLALILDIKNYSSSTDKQLLECNAVDAEETFKI